MLEIDNRRDEIIALLRKTGRENIENVVEWLDRSNFFTAPVSVNYHNNFRGGLARHSLDVYRLVIKYNAESENPLPDDSVTLCALLHDVCKSDVYYVDNHGNPCSDNKKFREGHGIRSVRILKSCGMPLSSDEELAIWWHMGKYEKPFDHPEILESTQNIPLCNLIRRADYDAAVGAMK